MSEGVQAILACAASLAIMYYHMVGMKIALRERVVSCDHHRD